MPSKKCKKNDDTPSTKIINLYENKDLQKHMTKSINPYYEIHKIKVPFRGVLIGSSGAGKTNLLVNIINIMKKTFNHLYIFTRAHEPIYDFLQEQLSSDLLTISYDLNDLRQFDESKYYGQSLAVFDDMVNEKDQKCISELFVRGRKIAGGISLLYLTQSYFKVPKIIRLQCQYVFILKVAGVKDLNLILSEYSLNASKKQLTNMYNYACNQNIFGNFLLIDLEANQNKTYRLNFNEYLNPIQFGN